MRCTERIKTSRGKQKYVTELSAGHTYPTSELSSLSISVTDSQLQLRILGANKGRFLILLFKRAPLWGSEINFGPSGVT